MNNFQFLALEKSELSILLILTFSFEGDIILIKAVVFDMYETLITLFESPLYFGTQMVEDAGITEEHFLRVWRPAEIDRTIGIISLVELLEKILKMSDCYSEEKMRLIIDKRINSRKEAFNHLNPEIVPLLEKLRE